MRWMHKHEKELTIHRYHANGDNASSLPCVLCKKELDKYRLKWKAFHDNKWIHSTDSELPKSKPTSRQSEQLFKMPRNCVRCNC